MRDVMRDKDGEGQMIKRVLMRAVLVVLVFGLFGPLIGSPDIAIAAEEAPQVKKSKSGICHPKGGTYYKRTKNYTPYSSMEACLKSGGRKPKR